MSRNFAREGERALARAASLALLALGSLLLAGALAARHDGAPASRPTPTACVPFVHNGAPLFVPRGTAMHVAGPASGAGGYTGGGVVIYEGQFHPGNSPALVTYGGDVVFGSSSSLTMELAGRTRGTQFDALNVAGKMTFGGTLNIALIDGFVPGVGDRFDLFDWGTRAWSFGTINVPVLAPFLAWDVSQLAATGSVSVVSRLTPIEQWRLLHFGSPANTGLGADTADPDGDGSVNLVEYGLLLDPRVPTALGLPTAGRVTVGTDDHLTITFTRPLSATDVAYRVEVSGTLLAYLHGSTYSSGGDVPSNENTTQVSRVANGGLETIVVRDNTPLKDEVKRFLRVVVVGQ